MAVDTEALMSSLSRLQARTDHEHDLVTALNEVTEACVELFDVAGSGIMLADDQNILRYTAASDEPGRVLELLESDTGQGPCTEAFVTDRTVPVTDLTEQRQWPDLLAAVARLEIRVGLERLLARLPELRLRPDRPLERARVILFYGYDHLHLEWGPERG